MKRYGNLLNDFVDNKLIPLISDLSDKVTAITFDNHLSTDGKKAKRESLAAKAIAGIYFEAGKVMVVLLKDKEEAEKNLQGAIITRMIDGIIYV